MKRLFKRPVENYTILQRIIFVFHLYFINEPYKNRDFCLAKRSEFTEMNQFRSLGKTINLYLINIYGGHQKVCYVVLLYIIILFNWPSLTLVHLRQLMQHPLPCSLRVPVMENVKTTLTFQTAVKEKRLSRVTRSVSKGKHSWCYSDGFFPRKCLPNMQTVPSVCQNITDKAKVCEQTCKQTDRHLTTCPIIQFWRWRDKKKHNGPCI